MIATDSAGRSPAITKIASRKRPFAPDYECVRAATDALRTARRRGTQSRMITDPGPPPPAAAGDPVAAAAAVHVSGLRKRYGDVVALAGVDLVVRAGEFFTLLGPSASGKTTLLRLIAGFERPDAGRIELAGRDVTRVPPYARDVNTVFQ